MNESEGASGVQNDSNKWSTTWHIQVPSKLRMFVWRLARQFMLTGELLKHRNMAHEDSCALCEAKDTSGSMHYSHAWCQVVFGP